MTYPTQDEDKPLPLVSMIPLLAASLSIQMGVTSNYVYWMLIKRVDAAPIFVSAETLHQLVRAAYFAYEQATQKESLHGNPG